MRRRECVSGTLLACDDIEANPKILKLGELDERAVEIGGVFNLEVGVWEQPCLARVEPNHIDRLGALAQRIVGEAGKLLHRDLCAQRLAQKRLAPIGFRRENLVAAQFANH